MNDSFLERWTRVINRLPSQNTMPPEQKAAAPAELAEDLSTTIDAWVEQEIANGDSVPDFWDDLNTSERLSTYLIERGWRR